jgi:hypothetical protein
VVIALALITSFGNVVLAVIRRGNGAKLAATERVAKSAQADAKAALEKVTTYEVELAKHAATVDDFDKRVSAPPTEPASMLSVRDRVERFEQELQRERVAREGRLERQHEQDIKLGRELERMSTNISNIQKQLEAQNGQRG